jgi:hypothetical protein
LLLIAANAFAAKADAAAVAVAMRLGAGFKSGGVDSMNDECAIMNVLLLYTSLVLMQ